MPLYDRTYSEEADEIIGTMPSWIVRWGITLIFVLLALLYLGVKKIHLGPTLPAFLSPNVAKILVEHFGIAGIGTVESDLALFFGSEKAAVCVH